MKKIFLNMVFLLTIMTACKREDSRQYSYWYVNEDSFKTNNVRKDIGKTIATLQCTDANNNFTIAFHLPYLPVTGNYPITKTSTQNPDSVGVNFYYQGQFYVLHKIGILSVNMVNNKSVCEVLPTWFVNYHDANDTVLIHGILCEP